MLKYERALKLHEQGKTRKQIAAAVRSQVSAVYGMLAYAEAQKTKAEKPVPGSAAWWKERGF